MKIINDIYTISIGYLLSIDAIIKIAILLWNFEHTYRRRIFFSL